MRDLGKKPGEILLACFDLVPVVLDEMKTGYIQLTIDQQPFLQGYVPIHQLHMMNKYKLGAYDANTGKALVTPDQVDALIALSAAGRALTRRLSTGPPHRRRAGIHAPPASDQCMQPIVKALLSRPEISALVMLLVVVTGFALYAPQFASSGNIRVMLFALPELGIVALGVGILMIAGEFDLSVGSVFALSPMLMVVAMGKWGVPPELAHRCSASPSRWPSATSTAGSRWPSASRASSPRWACCSWRARSRPCSPAASRRRSRPTRRPGCSWPISASSAPRCSGTAASPIILGVMLHFSNLGNWIFATGGQRQAADDMGIDTRRVKLFCFMLCSFLAGFAGMITTFRLKSALPALGEGLELQAIAAAVIGGTALTGGIGSVIGIIVGTCLIRAIDNGLVMARIDANWFRFAIGALTIVAVILNTTVRQRARRMR